MNPITEARGFTGAIDKYKKMFSECFTSLTKDEINRSFDIAMDSENRIPMCSESRNKVNGCLKDKGYSKKQIDDIGYVYRCIFHWIYYWCCQVLIRP